MSGFEIDVQIFDEFEGVVSENWVRRIAGGALETESSGPETHVSVVIADDEVVRELNRQHRGLDESTDVLSFSFTHEGEYYGEDERASIAMEGDFVLPPGVSHDKSLGEIIISYPQTQRQAEQAAHAVERELTVLLIHGVLHLLGHDHEEPDDEQTMKEAEARVMARLNSRNDVG